MSSSPLPSSSPAVVEPAPSVAAAAPRRIVRWHAALLYTAAALLSLVAALWAMQIWKTDLRTPFNYEGDAILNLTLIKTIVDKGWYLHTDALGAPAGEMLYDYPVGDNLVCAVIKGMSLFTSDPVLLCNLFFLATFPLVSLSALYAARRFGLSAGPALLVSFLYALLPYHFFRGTAHLYFSAYFLVPPAILVAWWVSSGTMFAQWWRFWVGLGVCLLLGCNMAYYPFFTCFLLLIAGIMAGRRGDRPHVIVAGLLIGAICFVLLLNLLPNLLYTHAHGAPESGRRFSFESEVGGLKITQLLLPVTGHRVPALARLKENYNTTHPLVNENDWVSLGFIGGLGFLVLVGWVLFIRRRAPADASTESPDGFANLLEHLSVFNAAAVLLATVGGFSVLFAVLISPQIRGYNRIGTFVAYFSLLTVAVGLEVIARRWVRSRLAAGCFAAALVLLGLLGLLDQTGLDAFRDWPKLASGYRNDQQFFTRVQAALPAGSMIFELPYEPFPEYGLAINQMPEYAEFRPYLHTRGLRWSYGVIKGRPGDTWEKNTAAQKPEQMLATLRRAGFTGLYIDRDGYADHGAALEGKLRALLGSAPLSDARGELALFKLPAPEGKPTPLEDLLPPPSPVWGSGFYNLEASSDQKTEYRWSAADSEAHFLNDTQGTRRVRLQALLSSNNTALSTLQIRSDVLNTDVTLDATSTPFSRVIELPPGSTAVHFHCDAKPAPSQPGDGRSLVWRMDNFYIDSAANPVPPELIPPLPTPTWTNGFYSLEADADQKTTYRWCAPDGEISFRNGTQDTRRVHLEATLRVGTVASAPLQIRGGGLDDEMMIEATGTPFSRTLDLPPGTTVIHLRCEAKPIPTGPGDDRALVWRVDNFKMEDAASLPPTTNPPLPSLSWMKNFYNPEKSPDQKSVLRWCGADGELRLWNDAQMARRVHLNATLRVAAIESTPLQIRSTALNESLTIKTTGTEFSRTLDLPPGSTVIRFHCDANPLPSNNGDPRSLVWFVENFKMEGDATGKSASAPAVVQAAPSPLPANPPSVAPAAVPSASSPSPSPSPVSVGKSEMAQSLPIPTWVNGFYEAEKSPDQKTILHWCGADGELRLRNDTKMACHVRLEVILRVAAVASAPLQIHSSVLNENVMIEATGTAFARAFDLPPGDTTIHFHCDAKPLPANAADPRALVWRMENFKLENAVDAPPSVSPTSAAALQLLPAPVWANGFYEAEKTPDQKDTFRWCGTDGDLRLWNDAQTARRVRLEATLRVAAVESATLQIRSVVMTEDLTIEASGRAFARSLDLPPGTTTIHFHCDAKPLPASAGDPRALVWRMENFKLEDAANAPTTGKGQPPLTSVWTNGFYDAEKSPDQKSTLRWCRTDGDVRFQNDMQAVCHVRLEANLRTAAAAAATLQIRGSMLKEDVTLTPEGKAFSRTFDLLPGDTTLHFHCDAQPLTNTANDTRTLVWRVDDFKLEDTPK